MNKLSSTVSELHDNFRKSCEILDDFANRVRTMINDLRGDNHGLSRQGKRLLKGEYVNYIDPFFENKTVEEITELTEYFTEEANRFTFAYPVTFENMIFIYLVAIFDAFFEDLTETVLRHAPNSTTRFRLTTRLRFVLRDFKVYTHRRAIEQRGDRHEFKDPPHEPSRLAPATG